MSNIFLGTMVVNEQPAYTGESPGYFTGLDLSEPMYLGSVPNYDSIPRVAGFREGFVGMYPVNLWLSKNS